MLVGIYSKISQSTLESLVIASIVLQLISGQFLVFSLLGFTTLNASRHSLLSSTHRAEPQPLLGAVRQLQRRARGQ